MPENLAQKLIRSHLVEGELEPGSEIALAFEQTLTQDATGTLVMLELEAMDLDRVRTEISVQYVDHNIVQADHRNPDDHRFLLEACRRFGIWYSPPGNGVSHPVHQEHFGAPGKALIGSDSHTPAAGSIGMLAIGAGGLQVALALAGEPVRLAMPRIWSIELQGQLPTWVSAKDVILELLRRFGVRGAKGFILEYSGDGLRSLSAMDRHVIANMGTELGATTSVFPSDSEVRRFLRGQSREDQWIELAADPGARYDRRDTIDLSTLEPLIAMPSSPGNVVPVREVEGAEIYQAYVGSSANPGYRDFAIVAEIVNGRRVPPSVSLDINPTTRQILENLALDGRLATLVRAGARIHQTGCNGCIGMGQAPASNSISLRTVPRNFPGRSGTRDDKVCLVSPETAAASALTGRITDPRKLGPSAPHVREPDSPVIDTSLFFDPSRTPHPPRGVIPKGPNIAPLPELDPLPSDLELPVLLRVGDDISTDEILPAGSRVLPYRSNIPEISRFAFEGIDPSYAARARDELERKPHSIVGGHNYGQGSSREHAALAPRYLGLRVVIAKSFARIHRENLINYGVTPLVPEDLDFLDRIEEGDVIHLADLSRVLPRDGSFPVESRRAGTFEVRHGLSRRQAEIILRGGLIPWLRSRSGRHEPPA